MVNIYNLFVVFQAIAAADRDSAFKKAYRLYEDEMDKVVAVQCIGFKKAYSI